MSLSRESKISQEINAISEYLTSIRESDVSPEVERKACQHLLDTLASVISGSQLLAGRKAVEFVSGQGKSGEALVLGTDLMTTAINAAMANGMSAHADETDDSHALSLSHPGCAIIPAALAAAERRQSSGRDLLRAVIAGYDIGCRISLALGRDNLDLRKSTHSSHALVGVFGAAAATAVIEGLDERQTWHTMSYAAQMASGVTTWLRDGRHVEKAYVFGGMPARNGVSAGLMVSSGLDGVDDVFTGHPNFLDAWSPNPDRSELAAGLGERYEVMRTNIKKYCVGSPAQAAVQAAVEILAEGRLEASEISGIEIRLPSDLAEVVNNRSMPDINVQYLVAGTLIDKEFSFAMAHDEDRMRNDPFIGELVSRTELIPDESMALTRQAKMRIHTGGFGEHSRHVEYVRGTVDDPMTDQEVTDKAWELIEPVLGADRTRQLIASVWNITEVENVIELRPLMQA